VQYNYLLRLPVRKHVPGNSTVYTLLRTSENFLMIHFQRVAGFSRFKGDLASQITPLRKYMFVFEMKHNSTDIKNFHVKKFQQSALNAPY